MNNDYVEPKQTIRCRTFNRHIAKEAERRGFDVRIDEINSRSGVTWYIIETHNEVDHWAMRKLLDKPPTE